MDRVILRIIGFRLPIVRKRITVVMLKNQQKFAQKVMIWIGACSQGVTPLTIFKDGRLDHLRCVDEVLPMALRYGNMVFGNEWTLRQRSPKYHTHKLSQKRCHDHFS